MQGVSVLIPAYNAARFVAETIRSVMAQTNADWEIVAVDDASSDGTYGVLQQMAAADPRIRVHRNEQNLGMTRNWNRCLSLASKDLIIKLDADDVFRPRTLEVLCEAMREPGVIGAGLRTLCCDESLEPFDGLPADDVMMRAGIDPYGDTTLDCARWYTVAAHGQQLWSSCAVMLPREFLQASGGYDERFGCASDTELFWRVLEQDGRFAHRGYVGVLYRVRGGSVSAVFRQNDWLTWEGTAANLLTLHRSRVRRGLPRALRLRYAYLWRRWQSVPELPPAVMGRLSSVVAEVVPPPRFHSLQLSLRNAVAALAQR
jgi:glycosyltransferase involved in cell wall biosynthesis